MILAGVVFALVLMAALLLTGYMERTAIRQERDRMAHIAQSVGSETYETLLSEMGKTRVLETYLIQTGGSYEGFEKVAPILLREEFVRNVLFAPARGGGGRSHRPEQRAHTPEPVPRLWHRNRERSGPGRPGGVVLSEDPSGNSDKFYTRSTMKRTVLVRFICYHVHMRVR